MCSPHQAAVAALPLRQTSAQKPTFEKTTNLDAGRPQHHLKSRAAGFTTYHNKLWKICSVFVVWVLEVNQNIKVGDDHHLEK
jgi:hypothetical protein